MGNNGEAGESWRKLGKTAKNWEACWEQLRGGTRGCALRTAAGRDTVDRVVEEARESLEKLDENRENPKKKLKRKIGRI